MYGRAETSVPCRPDCPEAGAVLGNLGQADLRPTRREMLRRSSIGFGSLALSNLLSKSAGAATHHPPAAKHVIFLFMSGGVSHVDSFDPKPALTRLHGQPMPVAIERTQFNNNGNVMASPFRFAQRGDSGLEISDLFPHVAGVADELAVIRSMTTPVNEHAQGNFFMHTGFPFMGHPTAGAWCSYGLGSENENLPAYMVLQSGNAVPPHGGVALFSNGFLPAQHQGSLVKADSAEAIAHIRGNDPTWSQLRRVELTRQLDQQFATAANHDPEVEAAIANFETAFRMQTAVPELCDLSDESAETRERYGVDSKDHIQAAYARQCLLARRMIERGVRFIELSCLTRSIGAGGAANPWDQHGELERGHRAMAEQVDQPIAALITDLRRRGLLDETLLVWAGEFGRTPFSQGTGGRDHNPHGFSVWLAGGGVKGGTAYGATDDLGYYAVENKCQVYDLWATVLHQLGLDHQQLTYRHGGRDFRLTDVHGDVLTDVLA